MLGHSKAAGKAGLIFHRIHGKTIAWNRRLKVENDELLILQKRKITTDFL